MKLHMYMGLSCSWQGLDMSFEVLKTVNINITKNSPTDWMLIFLLQMQDWAENMF